MLSAQYGWKLQAESGGEGIVANSPLTIKKSPGLTGPVVRSVSRLWATFDFAPLPFRLIGKGMSLSWFLIWTDGRRKEFHDRRTGVGAGRSRRGQGVPLKLFRCPVSQCRMQP